MELSNEEWEEFVREYGLEWVKDDDVDEESLMDLWFFVPSDLHGQ